MSYPIEYILILTATLILLLVIINVIKLHKKSNINNLRKRYIILHGGFSKDEASRALDRQIELLQSKYPQKETRWYFEKAIHDLEKDR